MPETQKQWIKRLEREGWVFGRGGNHQVKMTKPGHRPITLPEHNAGRTRRALRLSCAGRRVYRTTRVESIRIMGL